MNRGLKKALVLCAAVVALVAVFAVSAMASDWALTSSLSNPTTIYLTQSQANGKSVLITDYIRTAVIEGVRWNATSSNNDKPNNAGWVIPTLYKTSNGVTVTRTSGNVTTFNSTAATVNVGTTYSYRIDLYDNLADSAFADAHAQFPFTVVIVADGTPVPGAMAMNAVVSLANVSGGTTLNFLPKITNAGSPSVTMTTSSATAVASGITTTLTASGTTGTFNAAGATTVLGDFYNYKATVTDGAATYTNVPVKVTIVADPSTFESFSIPLTVEAANAGEYSFMSELLAHVTWGAGATANKGVLIGTMNGDLGVYTDTVTSSYSSNQASVVRADSDTYLWNTEFLNKNTSLVNGDKFSYIVTVYESLTTGQIACTGTVTFEVGSLKVYELGGNYMTQNVYQSAAGTTTVLRFAEAAANMNYDLAADTAAGIVNVTLDGATTSSRLVAGRYYYTLPSTLTVGQEITGEVSYPKVGGGTAYAKIKLTVVANPAGAATAVAAINRALTFEAGTTPAMLVTTNSQGYAGTYRGVEAWNDAVASFAGIWNAATSTMVTGSDYTSFVTDKGGFGKGGTTIKYQPKAGTTPGTDSTAKLAFTLTTVADSYGFILNNNYCIIDVAATATADQPKPTATVGAKRSPLSGISGNQDVTLTSSMVSSDYSAFTILEIGTLVMKQSTIGISTLYIDTPNASKVVATYLNNSTADVYKYIAAVLDVPSTAVGSKIITKAYIKYDDGGVIKYAYGPEVLYTIA